MMNITLCPFLTVITIITITFTYLLYTSRVQAVIYVCVDMK